MRAVGNDTSTDTITPGAIHPAARLRNSALLTVELGCGRSEVRRTGRGSGWWAVDEFDSARFIPPRSAVQPRTSIVMSCRRKYSRTATRGGLRHVEPIDVGDIDSKDTSKFHDIKNRQKHSLKVRTGHVHQDRDRIAFTPTTTTLPLCPSILPLSPHAPHIDPQTGIHQSHRPDPCNKPVLLDPCFPSIPPVHSATREGDQK